MKKATVGALFVFSLVITFVLALIIISFLIETLLLPADYLFYEQSPLCSSISGPLLMIPFMFVSYYIGYSVNKKIFSEENDFLHFIWFIKSLKKWIIPIIAVWIIAIYVSFTNLTYVTNDNIVVVTPINLKGEAYSYSDIEQITTGFGDKKISIRDYKEEGSFYYIITVDNKDIVFHMPSPNPDIDRYDDTYLELEDFDSALSEYNIPKIASSEGYEKCNFDKRYVDRFLRIIGE